MQAPILLTCLFSALLSCAFTNATKHPLILEYPFARIDRLQLELSKDDSSPTYLRLRSLPRNRLVELRISKLPTWPTAVKVRMAALPEHLEYAPVLSNDFEKLQFTCNEEEIYVRLDAQFIGVVPAGQKIDRQKPIYLNVVLEQLVFRIPRSTFPMLFSMLVAAAVYVAIIFPIQKRLLASSHSQKRST